MAGIGSLPAPKPASEIATVNFEGDEREALAFVTLNEPPPSASKARAISPSSGRGWPPTIEQAQPVTAENQ